MTDKPSDMSILSLRFADAGLEAAFREQQGRKFVRPFRATVLTLIAVVLVVWAALPLALPDVPDASRRFAIPALLNIAVFGIAYLLSRFVDSFVRRQQWIMLSGAWTLSGVLVVVCARAPAAWMDAAGLFLISVHTINCYGLLRMRFPWSCIAGWGTAAMYLGYLSHAGALEGHMLQAQIAALMTVNAFGMILSYQADHAARREFVAMRLLGQERERSERLLLNILPASIADRLKQSSASIADHSAEVTVLFADIVGFTPLSASKTPQELVHLLDLIFSEFDVLAERHGLEKIKTIGDAYMAAAGLPDRRDDHAQAAARMAQDMLAAVAHLAAQTGEPLSLRIGLNSGPVVAGVIGRKKFIYDLWGDTVNTASRMESHGIPGSIQCSEATARQLGPSFAMTERGAISVHGKGNMRTYLLRPSAAT